MKLDHLGDDVDAEAMEVLNELNLLSESEERELKNEQSEWSKGGFVVEISVDTKQTKSGVFFFGSGFQSSGVPTKRPLGIAADEDNIDSNLGLGELAQLTVNNDAETTYDITSSKEAFRKTWVAKYTLRSHFDGVRALAFHPTESVLITGSEDHTLKLWNLQKTVPAKKSASLDVEPLYTFR